MSLRTMPRIYFHVYALYIIIAIMIVLAFAHDRQMRAMIQEDDDVRSRLEKQTEWLTNIHTDITKFKHEYECKKTCANCRMRRGDN